MHANDTKGTSRRWAVLVTGLALGGGMGLIGLAGPAQAAVPGLVQVQASSPFTSADKSVTVTCPAGRVVLSPGGYLTGANGAVGMDRIRPNAALTSVTVRAAETDPFGGAWSVTAVAKCAFAPPGLTRVAVTTLSTSADKSVTATCPAGRFLTGAGGQFTNGGGEVIMAALTPNPALNAVTVTGDEDAVYTPTWSATAYAICANPLPGLVRVATTSPSNSTAAKAAVAFCPAGTVQVGGGASVGGGGEVVIDDISPAPTTMTVVADEEDPFAGNWRATSYAICALP